MNKALSLFTAFLFSAGISSAQEMSFENYNPPSTLKVPQNPVSRAKFPFVDIHSHQGGINEAKIDQLVKEMDELNMGVLVNLSGRGFGRGDSNSQQEYIKSMLQEFKTHAPGRFMVFTNLNFAGFGDSEWTRIAIKELEEDVAAGAAGLKIYKSLGLNSKDINGNRIPVDHPDLDPVWAKAGELGIPVLIHSADPAQFWQPMDSTNERWLELKLNPNRKRSPTDPAPFEQIIAEQHRVFAKHPKTTFINAHMGWMANDLDAAGAHLDKYPNVNFEIGLLSQNWDASQSGQRNFSPNIKTVFSSEKTLTIRRNFTPTLGFWRQKTSIFPTTKKIPCLLENVRIGSTRRNTEESVL